MKRIHLFIVLLSLPLFLYPSSGYGEVGKKPLRTVRTTIRPKPVVAMAARPSPVVVAPPVASLKAETVITDKKTLNLRLHTLHLFSMIADKNTTFSGRADLDFVLGSGVTVGPSIIYHMTSSLDPQTTADGGSQYMDEGVLELGLLSNIYLKGNTSTGGFVLRPHLYWIDPHGDRTATDDTVLASSTNRQGLRGGSELIYQVILPSGFNFEIGGGFTYHISPYRMEYPAGGTLVGEPSSRLLPTLSAAIGWTF